MSKYKHFSKVERLELSILLKKGYSRREIATSLGRSHSSVVRELKRNSVKGIYDPKKADLQDYSHTDIAAIIDSMNTMPMKCLGWRTPNEVFEEQLRVQTLSERYPKGTQLTYPRWCT